MRPGLAACDKHDVELLMAEPDNELILMLMNDLATPQTANVTVGSGNPRQVELAPYGLELIRTEKKQ